MFLLFDNTCFVISNFFENSSDETCKLSHLKSLVFYTRLELNKTHDKIDFYQ